MAATETTEKTQTSPKSSSGWGRTFTYAGVAAACLAATGLFEWRSRPAKIEEFGKVGQEFYEEFTDPTAAAGLEVFVFDREAVKPREFRVERNDKGQWVIPSHHDYPADAEDRLAQTATSIIGIERGALVTRWEADHGRYGVVNPKTDALSVEDVEGVGQRLILKKDDDSVLADYIIGKAVEDRENEYYVRHPEEDDVYIAKLDINLSTKFTDWIDNKLFTFSNGDVMELDINDYTFDEVSGTMTETIVTNLSRKEAWGTDWNLEPAAAENEEINTDSVRDTLSALADLEAIGVRPKQEGLTPDLRLDRNVIRNQVQISMLQQDLLARGFVVQPGQDGALDWIARDGELVAGTNDGLRYRLYFGSIFTGSQEELEIGFSDGDSAEKKDGEAEAKSGDGEQKAPAVPPSEEAADPASQKPGRYLFVRVAFDENLLDGPKSVPLEPQTSARLVELEAVGEEVADGEADPKAKDQTAEPGEGKGKPDEPTEIETLQREYATAMTQFKNDKRDYEARLEKVKEGQEKAGELNRRFAEWYYVIPGESFEKLAVDRSGLVKPKEKTDPAAAGPGQVVVPDAPPLTGALSPTGVPPTGALNGPSNGPSPENTTPASTGEPATSPAQANEPTAIDPAADEPAVDPSPEAAGTATPAEAIQGAAEEVISSAGEAVAVPVDAGTTPAAAAGN